MKLAPKTTALDLTTKYAQLFNHNDFGFITAANSLKPNWTTNTAYPLSLGELVRLYSDPEQLIGVGFGSTSNRAVLDIDFNSPLHPRNNIELFKAILNALEKIGIMRYLVIQSSHSQGIHIIIPLPKHYPTYHVAAAIQVTLIDEGFPIGNGVLEIFPNCKAYVSTEGEEFSHYKRHRLPLQPNSGSYLLEDDGLNPQPIPDTLEDQLSAFLNQWEMAAAGQDIDFLDRSLPQLYDKYKQKKNHFKYRSTEEQSKRARDWRTALENSAMMIGWTDIGQTYQLLPKFLALGVVFLRLKGEELFDWMYKTITTAPGYEQYCRHKHEIVKIIRSWIKTNERTRYYTPYGAKPTRPQPFPFGDTIPAEKQQRKPNPENQKRAETVIHQLQMAVRSVLHKFTPELKIGGWEKMIQAQMKKLFNRTCSNSTLTKYKFIWNPKYWEYFPTLKSLGKNAPENIQVEGNSDSTSMSATGLENTQTDTEQSFQQAKFAMICNPLDNLPKINIPPQPRTPDYKTTEADTTPFLSQYPDNPLAKRQVQGKFEVMAALLAKIIGVAAIVFNFGVAAGIPIVDPAVAVNSVETEPVAAKTPLKAPITFHDITNTEEAIYPTSETPLAPCEDPRIPLAMFVKYNPNQIGTPWTTEKEFYKFLGYLMIVAKMDKSIKNPHAWARTAILNIKERGINRHWLNFTGQEMLDPNSPQAQYLRQYFGSSTAPANVTINRSSESIENIVERGSERVTSPDPLSSPNPSISNDVEVEVERVSQQQTPTPPEPDSFSSPNPSSISNNMQQVSSRQTPPEPDPLCSPKESVPISTTEIGHQHSQHNRISCPKCQIPTPAVELERWDMCCFCAQKILWRGKI